MILIPRLIRDFINSLDSWRPTWLLSDGEPPESRAEYTLLSQYIYIYIVNYSFPFPFYNSWTLVTLKIVWISRRVKRWRLWPEFHLPITLSSFHSFRRFKSLNHPRVFLTIIIKSSHIKSRMEWWQRGVESIGGPRESLDAWYTIEITGHKSEYSVERTFVTLVRIKGHDTSCVGWQISP